MKKIIKFIVGVFVLISAYGCKSKKTIYYASDDIECTFNYTIRKGETIYCEITSFVLAQNYSTFKDKFTWESNELIVEKNKLNNSLIFQNSFPIFTIICNEVFEDPIYIDHVLCKVNDNVYVNIPVNMTFTYNSDTSEEPAFGPSYSMIDDYYTSCNSLTFARSDGFYSDVYIANKAWFIMTPKFNNLKNANIEIDNISFVNNEINKIKSIKYCIFSESEDDFSTVQTISYPYSEYPIIFNDKDYDAWECLVIEFDFSDSIENSSDTTGGTLKFNVKINGDNYTVYRNLYYYRNTMKIGE